MTTPRYELGRAFSARRLILLATAGNLAIATLLVGPDSFRHSILPTVSAANAAEGAASSRGWIGVQIQLVTSAIAESLGMKESKGALVAEPMADSPAAKVGIQSRDVITAVNGNPVKDARDLAMQIGGMAPGAAANVTIWREGAEKSISLTLGEMPKERAAAMPQLAATDTEVPKLGLPVRPFFYPLTSLPAFNREAEGRKKNPVAYDVSEHGINLPCAMNLTDADLDRYSKGVHDLLGLRA